MAKRNHNPDPSPRNRKPVSGTRIIQAHDKGHSGVWITKHLHTTHRRVHNVLDKAGRNPRLHATSEINNRRKPVSEARIVQAFDRGHSMVWIRKHLHAKGSRVRRVIKEAGRDPRLHAMGKPRKPSKRKPVSEARIIHAFDRGHAGTWITKHLHTSGQRVHKVLKKAGRNPRLHVQRIDWEGPEGKQIEDLYRKQKLSSRDLASLKNVSREAIKHGLKVIRGVKLRPSKEGARLSRQKRDAELDSLRKRAEKLAAAQADVQRLETALEREKASGKATEDQLTAKSNELAIARDNRQQEQTAMLRQIEQIKADAAKAQLVAAGKIAFLEGEIERSKAKPKPPGREKGMTKETIDDARALERFIGEYEQKNGTKRGAIPYAALKVYGSTVDDRKRVINANKTLERYRKIVRQKS